MCARSTDWFSRFLQFGKIPAVDLFLEFSTELDFANFLYFRFLRILKKNTARTVKSQRLCSSANATAYQNLSLADGACRDSKKYSSNMVLCQDVESPVVMIEDRPQNSKICSARTWPWPMQGSRFNTKFSNLVCVQRSGGNIGTQMKPSDTKWSHQIPNEQTGKQSTQTFNIGHFLSASGIPTLNF